MTSAERTAQEMVGYWRAEVVRLQDRADRLREMLRKHQWASSSVWGNSMCPECEAQPSEGHGHSENPHSPRSCALADLLEAKP